MVEAGDERPRGADRRRSDAERNRARLVAAVGAVVRRRPDGVSIQAFAEAADVSVATAYRFFPSVDALVEAFMQSVLVSLRNYSHDCQKSGRALFEAVLAEWIRLVQEHGRAMAHLRSRRGYLERLNSGDPVICIAREAWERPIRSVMRSLRVDDDQFPYALFLYNQIFDPREILDLIGNGLTEAETRRRLLGTYYGALTGWQSAKHRRAQHAPG